MNKDVMSHNMRQNLINGLEAEKVAINMEIKMCEECARLCPEDVPALLKHFNKKYSIGKNNLNQVAFYLRGELKRIDKAISDVNKFVESKQKLLAVRPR